MHSVCTSTHIHAIGMGADKDRRPPVRRHGPKRRTSRQIRQQRSIGSDPWACSDLASSDPRDRRLSINLRRRQCRQRRLAHCRQRHTADDAASKIRCARREHGRAGRAAKRTFHGINPTCASELFAWPSVGHANDSNQRGESRDQISNHDEFPLIGLSRAHLALMLKAINQHILQTER